MEMTQKDAEFLKTYDAERYKHPSVTVDMLIFTIGSNGKLRLLLIKRKYPPFEGCWAVPGGFLEVEEDNSLDEAAARELKEETGIEGIYMEQLYTFGNKGRDPRTRVISVAYIAMIPEGMVSPKAGDDAAEAEWFEVCLGKDKKPVFSQNIRLAFDHEDIVATALDRMQGKISYTPIAFEFLSDKNRFTIQQLQKVHEAILNKSLDAANFRRSFFANYVNRDMAKETGEKNKDGRHRPSMYYQYLGTV